LDQKEQADISGQPLLNDTAAVEKVIQGAASDAVQQAANDPSQIQSVVNALTGSNLGGAIGPAAVTIQETLSTATEHVALADGTQVATFTSSNLLDPASAYTAAIDWGDGTLTAGTITGSNGAFTVSAPHTYADEGNDTLSVTVTRTEDGTQTVASGQVVVAENDALTASRRIRTRPSLVRWRPSVTPTW
jgi:hypothetical protein